jgi:hypothetical protein
MISERTKQALASAKANGKQLGGLRDHGRVAKEAAVECARALTPLFDDLADKVRREIARIDDRDPRTRLACCGDVTTPAARSSVPAAARSETFRTPCAR